MMSISSRRIGCRSNRGYGGGFSLRLLVFGNNHKDTKLHKDMTVDEILGGFAPFGVKLGLARCLALEAAIGNPHEGIPVVHVAGTNGKGSVCACVGSILQAAGFRVGRYISPHLVAWNERICVDGISIDDRDFEEILRGIQGKIVSLAESPTQFEVLTAAAWLYFRQCEVDIAVIEVGLGGRLDATNVVDRPLVTAIASIGLDHQQQLGDTLAAIAAEKAGIFKKSQPAVVAEVMDMTAKEAIAAKAALVACPLVWTPPAEFTGEKVEVEGSSVPLAVYRDIVYPLPLLGEFQRQNSAIAIEIVCQLRRQGWQIADADIYRGMSIVRWQGRIEWVTWRHRQIIVDGAHNPPAAAVLRQYVDTLDRPIAWIIGMMGTKDRTNVLKTLLRPQDTVYCVPVPDPVTVPASELAIDAMTCQPQLASITHYEDLWQGLAAAMADDRQIVLSGSLYLIGSFFAKWNRSS
jgi:dihydrofolate synthase / folylpolyglutamate synthase